MWTQDMEDYHQNIHKEREYCRERGPKSSKEETCIIIAKGNEVGDLRKGSDSDRDLHFRETGLVNQEFLVFQAKCQS